MAQSRYLIYGIPSLLLFINLVIFFTPPRYFPALHIPTFWPPTNNPAPSGPNNSTEEHLIAAYDTLQAWFYHHRSSTYPSAIDWTAAVIVHILTHSPNPSHLSLLPRIYTHQNAPGLRTQAYDDQLWVVLQWLSAAQAFPSHADKFHHRALEFYELASAGWDTTLCAGGMIWSPYLLPYKNAVTNELFVAASIGMYRHHPNGNETHLRAAVDGYRWLTGSGMRNDAGLYCDGFHITERRCNRLNRMLYTYNQGILLSGLRGLWEATRDEGYLLDAAQLVDDMRSGSMVWDGVMEERCDPGGYCNQNGQMFKGIYFLHLMELCRGWWEKSTPEVLRKKCGGEWRGWVKGNMEAALSSRNKDGVAGMWWNAPTGDELKAMEIDENIVVERPGVEVGSADGSVKDLVNQCMGDTVECEIAMRPPGGQKWGWGKGDLNDRGRGRTVETHASFIGVILAARELRI